jgi:hypothetical protein
MRCANCNGSGKTTTEKGEVVLCFFCDGHGELCDFCGEHVGICSGECMEEDNEEKDDARSLSSRFRS